MKKITLNKASCLLLVICLLSCTIYAATTHLTNKISPTESSATLALASGDFRSIGTGTWSTIATWQTFDGSSWVAATEYPGQSSGSYTVTIQTGHNVTISTNLTTSNMGDVIVNGTLTLAIGTSPNNATLSTLLLDINGGTLSFTGVKAHLTLPNTAAVIVLENSGTITTTSCNNNNDIYIGPRVFAACVGGGSGVYTFGEVVASGGNVNANITNPATGPVAITGFNIINLAGGYSGTATNVTYKWTVRDPNFSVTTLGTGTLASNTNTTTSSFTPTITGQYLVSLEIITSALASNVETRIFNVTAPEISVFGNGNLITDGSTIPVLTNNTNFGATNVSGGIISKTFTINNTGDATLNLNGTPIVKLTGTNAADFSVTTNPTSTVAAGGSTTFTIKFDPSNIGTRTAIITIANDDSDENPYDFYIQGTGTAPEIAVSGNGNVIVDGDTTPTITDNTNFGATNVSGGIILKTFTINNTGDFVLNLNGTPIVKITGTNAADFSVTANPTSTVAAGGSTTFTIKFDPSNIGTRNATITIANDDSDENPYDFSIQGTGTAPEIAISGNGNVINDGDTTPSLTDNTNFGSTDVTGGIILKTFIINNIGDYALNLTSSPYVIISGTNAADFSVTTTPSSPIGIAGSTSFTITFNPSARGVRTAKITIANDDSDENPYDFSIQGTGTAPEMNVIGKNIIINDGDTTPSLTDDTDFNSINIETTITKTFTIKNIGDLDLLLTGTPLVSISGSSDFVISTQPSIATIASNGTTTFKITFSPLTVGTKTATINISNNDPGTNKNPYNFTIQGVAEQNFFDSDGDGVFDNIDIDDDNDGITDNEEELACQKSAVSHKINYKFLNETFGTGNRTTINTTYDAITTYCYEDGTVGTNSAACPTLSSKDLNDGEYTVYHKAANGDGINQTPNNEVASWADAYWYTGEDHTTGDANGRMAMFNASYDPGVFYTATIVGALPNVPITYSFWVLNLDTTTAPGIATRLRPDILVEFRDVNNNLLTSISTGDIPPSINGNPSASWHQFTANLTFNVTKFYVYFINNETGGTGNDLALDDIVISQTLCDTDNDGVADLFDLDSDNDGIPDVVEAGLGNLSNGRATLTGCPSWVDSNNNGMHDAAEGHIVLNSDGDLTPNYLDLDSDNDSIFDVDESGAGNTGNPNYQNGDGDITGDGVGDGPDSDAIRQTDINSDGILEYFTDGILDIYDYFNGGTMATGYGNTNQGLTGPGWFYYVKDSDNDGIPDYMDLTSDGINFDISKTLYANLDANNDGKIDDTNDLEGDGIVDLFDTNDNTFGSPRDLNRKLHLYFDGRNDYAQEPSVINGWLEGSLMAWIKIDPTASGSQIIVGQNNFYIQLNANKSISAYSNGNTISNGVIQNTNQWIHVAATYKCNCASGDFKLYINGTEVANASTSGSLNADTSSFTIGRKPDTNSNYFKGYIDEVRVFNKMLTKNELQKMVYQEIENNSGIIRGNIIPRNITNFIDISNIIPLNWTSLVRYYRMDIYKDNIIDDLSTAAIDVGTGTKIFNSKIIDYQTAPLPYETTTTCSGNWTSASNWLHGDIWDISNNTPESAIVKIKGNIQTSNTIKTVGLILDSNTQITVNNDKELNTSWYLKLDGKIDLQGESQLIQGLDSNLDPTSSGKLEKDQQGTSDKFTYNYWSSPVGLSNNTTNNNSYKVTDIFQGVNFLTSGYNGTASPLGIADYWIWKFANKLSDSYASWQHVRSTGTLLAGEGFTMKGPGTGSISTPQNYVLLGKPNNGDINLTISAGNDYLVGNPYPSAMDAEQFILDNGNTIAGPGSTTGTLYFWEHWGGGSHNLSDYQGGYATYSLAGGVPAASLGTNDPDVATGGSPTKIPGRYIPVAQGFFVTAENAGTIKFNNGQRVFQVEDGSNSLFIKQTSTKKSTQTSATNQPSDTRMKLRLGFNSINKIHRQLLVTADSRATAGYDWGFDSKYIDTQMDDMYWMLNNEKYSIEGVNQINDQSIFPIGIHTKKDGLNTIRIDKLENAPNDIKVFLHDKELNIYHNLKQSDYSIFLAKGQYLNRFEITFSQPTVLSVNNVQDNPIDVYFSNEKNSIIINNPGNKLIESIEMINILGQSLFKFETNTTENHITYKANQIKIGTYVLNIKTEFGKISKKVLIN